MRLSVDDIEAAAGRATRSLAQCSRSDAPLTEADLPAVDAALDDASRFRDALPADVKEGLVRDFGCLVLELGRRAHGGRYAWLDASAEPVLVVGEPSRHIAIATWGKVRGRLDGDTADSVTFLYGGWVEQVLNAPTGARRLFV